MSKQDEQINGTEPLSQWKIINLALNKNPWLKYGLALTAIVMMISIIAGVNIDWRVAVVGVILFCVIMVALLIFAKATVAPKNTFASHVQVLTWSFLLLTIVTGYALFSSVFFQWPLNLKCWLVNNGDCKPQQSNAISNDYAKNLDFTVHLRDSLQNPLSNLKGTLSIVLDNHSRPEKIPENGEVHFLTIPSSFKNKTVTLEITNEFYVFDNSNSKRININLDSNNLFVRLSLEDGFKYVRAYIVDEYRNPIPNAQVLIGEMRFNTDSNGYFKKYIPFAERKDHYLIEIKKEGFKTMSLTLEPSKEYSQIPLQRK